MIFLFLSVINTTSPHQEKNQMNAEEEEALKFAEEKKRVRKIVNRIKLALTIDYKISKHNKLLDNPDSLDANVKYSTGQLAKYGEQLTEKLLNLMDDYNWHCDLHRSKLIQWVRYFNLRGVDTQFTEEENKRLKKEHKYVEKKLDEFKKLDIIPEWKELFAQK